MYGKISRIRWSNAYRIIPSRFPPIDLFEDLELEPDELEDIVEVESLTNDRIRQEVGDLSLIPTEERMVGPGCTPIMASFTHLNPSGGRFTTPTFGAFYAGHTLKTAVLETVYHQEKFLKSSTATHHSSLVLDMRVYETAISGQFQDIRQLPPTHKFYRKDDYTASQTFAEELKSKQSYGIVYNSVRHQGGEAVAVFRPSNTIKPCKQTKHLSYIWDGNSITHWQEISKVYKL